MNENQCFLCLYVHLSCKSLAHLLVNHVALLALGVHLGRDFKPILGPIPGQVIGLVARQLGQPEVLIMQPLLMPLRPLLELWCV
jgi:hypothetical protein